MENVDLNDFDVIIDGCNENGKTWNGDEFFQLQQELTSIFVKYGRLCLMKNFTVYGLVPKETPTADVSYNDVTFQTNPNTTQIVGKDFVEKVK